MFDRMRLERVMKLPDLPAHFRKYLLQTTLYTLQQMPADPVEQRKLMLEQDTRTHYEDGRVNNYRSARFVENFYPNLASLPETITCSAETTHDITEKAEDYRVSSRSSIMSGIHLEAKFLGEKDTEDKDMFMLSLRLEKFWRTVAATAELTEKEHNLVPVGQFGVYGYRQGESEYRGLQFNYADYPKIIAALQKMLVSVDTEINAEAHSTILDRINDENASSTRGK